MKKIILFSVLILIGFASMAQDSTNKAPNRQEKKQQKKAHRNSIIKQEEEGVLSFNRETAFSAELRTNGYGLFMELGRSRTPRYTNLYTLEISEIKHNKEEKSQSTTNVFSNSFVFGKINNFYQVKLGFGQQYVFGQKGNKNGVAVLGIVNGGISVGLLKPYYIQVQDQSTTRDVKYQSSDSTLFLNALNNPNSSGSGFTKGWGELKVKPGLFIKTALRFDFGRYNESIQALEIGMSLDAYASKIPLMVYNDPKQLFFQGHIAFVFGHRK